MPAAGANRVRRGGFCRQPEPIARVEGVYAGSWSPSCEESWYMPAAGANRVEGRACAATASASLASRATTTWAKRFLQTAKKAAASKTAPCPSCRAPRRTRWGPGSSRAAG
eukprot:741134-Prorocentrum_minimum.AAC.1